MLRHFIQEQLVLPLSDMLTGQSVHSKLRFLMKSCYWSREQLDAFQNERLRLLVEHIFRSVPFYQDYAREHNLQASDIQTKADLYKLPVVSKEIMRAEGIERFTSTAFPANKRILMSSSGSTGQPFKHYITREDYSMDIAANLRGWYDMGWRLGDKYVKISQNPRSSFLKRLQDIVTRNMYIATADLSDRHLIEIMRQIESYRPVAIRSYPDPLYIIAQFRLQHPEFVWQPMAITTGNTLHDHIRRTIEEAFHCPVYDSYASEGNAVCFECHTHEGYHIAEEYGITEVLDEEGIPVVNGQGRVVTTDLWNFAHPFIRYDVQDRVEVTDKRCSCGRAHKLVKRILGRDNEVLIAPNGKRFIVHHFTVYFEPTVTPALQDSIDQFQVIRHTDQSATFLLVVNGRYTDAIGRLIADYWQEQFGGKVDIRIVDRIPIMHNNKRRFIIIEK
ncbi:MAG: phenylacetate--CoA ligase family protein [Paludibacteraceae bacterium]|nr:phenylacetate--CoA ligase family protein [Paludibacteraceae bacterium]